MHRLWRYDVFRFAQNDVVPLRVTMMRCLPQCAVRHTSLGEAVIIGGANIICRRQTSLKKDQVFRLGLFSGSGIGIRTPTYRVRVCCATVTQFRYVFNGLYSITCRWICQYLFIKFPKNYEKFCFQIFHVSKNSTRHKIFAQKTHFHYTNKDFVQTFSFFYPKPLTFPEVGDIIC